MRINTDFKDYYDGVLYNITEPNNKIWNRVTKYNDKTLPKFYIKQNDIRILSLFSSRFLYNKEITQKLKCVIVCGEVYLYLLKSINNVTTYIYNEKEITEILKTIPYLKYYETDLNIIKNTVKKYFKTLESDLMNNGELPVIINIDDFIHSSFINRPELIYTLNPILKNIEFSKCMDSYTLAQNIDVFVNEQLNTENIPDNLSDKDKIRSYGFDDKYGFRTRKKTK